MLKKNDKGLSPIQKKAIPLIISRELEGKTMEDVANELGMTRQGIYKWHKDQLFIEELNKQADELLDASIPDVYQILLKILYDDKVSTKDRLSAIDKVLKIKGKYQDKKEIVVGQKENEQLDDAYVRYQLAEVSERMIEAGVISEKEVNEILEKWDGNKEKALRELKLVELEQDLFDENIIDADFEVIDY